VLDKLRVTVIQFEPKPFREKQKNLEFHLQKIKELGGNSDLIIFPEMSLTGFFEMGDDAKLEYWKYAETVTGKNVALLIEAAKENDVHIIFGMAEQAEIAGNVYNTALLISPADGIKGVTRKMHLPHLEKLFYLPGNEPEVFNTPIGNIGICICYDAWFPETSRILALKGADIIVNVADVWAGDSNVGFSAGELGKCKERIYDVVPVAQAMLNQVYFIVANCSGSWYGGKELGFCARCGRSQVVDPFGNIVSLAAADSEILQAVLDKNKLLQSRAGFSFFMDRTPWNYQRLCHH